VQLALDRRQGDVDDEEVENYAMSQRTLDRVRVDQPESPVVIPDETPGIPAGIWVRVSSGGQDEANQIPDLERYCDQRGYTIATRYTLHAKSASKGKQQEALDQALDDMRHGVIKVLVIWHSDRIERRDDDGDGTALLTLLGRFRDAGGRVESVQEPTLGQLDFGSNVTTYIAGLINAEKSRHIADQVQLAHNRSRANGALVSRYPFGYTGTGPKYHRALVPTKIGREYVPQIFARCIAGESAASIAAWLTREGVPVPNKKDKNRNSAWAPKSVGQIIRNPVYIGRRRNGNGVTVHTCEALVDAATFKRAGKAYASRPKRGPQKATTALLTGLLFCRQCGGPMYRLQPRTGPLYYRCSADPKFGAARKSECRNMVPLAEMDAEVLKWLAASTQPVYDREWVEGSNYEAEIEQVNMELFELPRRDLPEDQEDAERARLRADRRRLQALPSIPGHWEDRETGETYGQMFTRLAGDAAALRAEIKGRIQFRVFRNVNDCSVRLLDPDLAANML
jgi:DNA invertase Pin-like site-specific DNA recombinase